MSATTANFSSHIIIPIVVNHYSNSTDLRVHIHITAEMPAYTGTAHGTPTPTPTCNSTHIMTETNRRHRPSRIPFSSRRSRQSLTLLQTVQNSTLTAAHLARNRLFLFSSTLLSNLLNGKTLVLAYGSNFTR